MNDTTFQKDLDKRKNNDKVPIAIFCCFSIAFIIQVFLKALGVFVFEKAITWEVFKIIDNSLWLQIVYYTIITSICIYCLSFTFTTKPYGDKWYHSLVIIIVAFVNTYIKLKYTLTYQQHILFDILMYIIVPLFVNFTTKKENRLFKFNLFFIILTITIQIALYYCYLGLNYWSNLSNSLLPQIPVLLPASTMFLINFEVYIGLISIMLSINIVIRIINKLINKLKEEKEMNIPVNIATEEAKEKELEEVEAKKEEKEEKK